MTAGAVSQQIRALEEHFGVTLFERLPRALILTAAGQEFFAAATRHLRGIAQAADRIRPRSQQIAVSVAPDFASRWLMPRLSLFAQLNPEVEVRIDASQAVADFEREAFDLAIRCALVVPAGVEARLLLRQQVLPYCSPAYHAAHLAPHVGSARWSRARLLHESHPYDLWRPWFSAKGYGDANAQVGLYFSHGLLAILAAIDGEGVTLQTREYVEREVDAGALVAADEEPFETGLGYYLVWPKRALSPAGERFRDWILSLVEPDAVRSTPMPVALEA